MLSFPFGDDKNMFEPKIIIEFFLANVFIDRNVFL